jgi:hypothetical protein
VQFQLGLESGVVVGGFDKSGEDEDAIGRGGVLEKSWQGGGEVGRVYKPSFELSFGLWVLRGRM